MTESLGTALPAKMREIREHYIPAYQSIGANGGFAIAMMSQALTRAEQALAAGDVVAIARSYTELCEFKL